MNTIWKFRLLALLMILIVGGVSISNLAAEFLRPALPLPVLTASTAALPDQLSAARLASAIAPFRSDLRADYASALTSQALKSQYSAPAQRIAAARAAQAAVKDALKVGPHESRMWLALARLQTRSNDADPLVAESLKMSYLTGPNRTDLIPIRLESATSASSLNDPDLRDLARGDVRAIVMQRSDAQQTLAADYAHASEIGKAYLEQSLATIAPKLVDTLRKPK